MHALIQESQILKKSIEKLRRDLVNMASNEDLFNTELLKKSRELDKLINEYNALYFRG